MTAVVQRHVVRHEELVLQEFFNNRMAAVLDLHGLLRIQARPYIVVVMGGAGQAVQAVDAGNGPGGLLHFPDMALYVPAELAEKLVFQLQHPFLRRQHLDFKLLQRRRDVPFGVDQRLLAHIVIGNRLRIGVGNFEVIAEYLRIAYFHLDACLFFFLLFQLLQIGLAVSGNRADFIELGRITVADDAAVADNQSRIVLDAAAQQVVHIVVRLDPIAQALEQVRIGLLQDMPELGYRR